MEHSILLVDDDERLLSGLIRALHKQPFKVYTARNGEEALWILKTHRIDVIVSDERMPGISGSTLLTWVAENCPETTRILLTGHAEAEVAIRAINEGNVARFFIKPCNEARLAMAIHKAIEEKDAREQNERMLASSREQLRDLERHNEELLLQTRAVSEDLQRPLRQIDDCCRQLEEHLRDRLDGEAQTWLSEARSAATEARQLASQFQCPTA